ncbi:MAG: FHIPEP family type III secretion protein [Spirochaetota bacterium]
MRKNTCDTAMSAVFACACIALIIIPIPAMINDILLAANIFLGISILAAAHYAVKRNTADGFPAVVFAMTVFRFTLAVTIMRHILAEGTAFDIRIIQIPGVLASSHIFAAGMLIYLVLTGVNYFLITHGTARISEVAAQFALDSMPPKMLAVDAALNAKTISWDEATAQRKEIRRIVDMHGTADGAATLLRYEIMTVTGLIMLTCVSAFLLDVSLRGASPIASANIYSGLAAGSAAYMLVSSMLSQIALYTISTGGEWTNRSRSDIS